MKYTISFFLIFFSVSCGQAKFLSQPTASSKNEPSARGHIDTEQIIVPNAQDSTYQNDDTGNHSGQSDNGTNTKDGSDNPSGNDCVACSDNNNDNNDNNDSDHHNSDIDSASDSDDAYHTPNKNHESGTDYSDGAWDAYCGACTDTPPYVGSFYQARHECFVGQVSTIGETRCQAVNSICSLIHVRRYYIPSDIACVKKGRPFPELP